MSSSVMVEVAMKVVLKCAITMCGVLSATITLIDERVLWFAGSLDCHIQVCCLACSV